MLTFIVQCVVLALTCIFMVLCILVGCLPKPRRVEPSWDFTQREDFGDPIGSLGLCTQCKVRPHNQHASGDTLCLQCFLDNDWWEEDAGHDRRQQWIERDLCPGCGEDVPEKDRASHTCVCDSHHPNA